MPEKQDIIIIGGGPAGISAALTARNRGNRVLVITTDSTESGLSKAKQIDNYPGIPEISGLHIQQRMEEHAKSCEIPLMQSRVIGISPTKHGFFVSAGADICEATAIILTVGITQKSMFPGEARLLGQGVSYCATCDGMLYRQKKIAVVGLSSESIGEANFLKQIGCDVTFFTNNRNTDALNPEIPIIRGKKFEVLGTDLVEALMVDGTEYPCVGIFILRNSIAMSSLLPGLDLENGHIAVDRSMKTNIPGVFAAGDCTGLPYQLPKAVGEGNVAALTASEWVANQNAKT